ncbi:MAG TPA: HD domain-containing protein [Holophagaceae bacterium]|nr:HD domain-containing protein [Holophagaceae bacterium]
MNEALRRIRAALGEAQLVVVGGAVRDELLKRPHADWDLATDLLPEEVMRRAKHAGLRALPTGLQHGTVTVLVEHQPFEITTFRSEGEYRDGRHPDHVRLGVTLEEDLSRRDFTFNAMALPVEGGEVVDPFGGRKDLEAGLIRAVGDPLQRFGEDGLRPYRACRFASQLGFRIEAATLAAIPERLATARKVAVERVMVELTKLLCGRDPKAGLQALADTGLLDLCLPELRPMQGCTQNRHHRFPVWEHMLEVVGFADPEPALRWAAVLHDVGKPSTRTVDETREVHFYGHEEVSVRLAGEILGRLRASKDLTQEVVALVRHHGTHPTDAWSDAACRRLLRKLDEDQLSLDLWGRFRIADQLGKGWGEEPFRSDNVKLLARLQALADAKPPLRASDLALDGRALMALAGRKGGPWLGELQKHLLEAVIEEPGLNTGTSLEALARSWLQSKALGSGL